MAEQESQDGSGDQKPAGKGGLIVTLIVAIAAIAGGISLPFAMEHLTTASADAGDGEEQTLPEPEPEEAEEPEEVPEPEEEQAGA